MHPPAKATIEQRAVRAAEAVFADHGYVSPIDIITGIGFLATVNVERWRAGRIRIPEELMQGSDAKLTAALQAFQPWAQAKGLQPSETPNVIRSRDGMRNLRPSKRPSGSVPAAIRHRHTDYDDVLVSGMERSLARERVSAPVQQILDSWRG